jgi:hypothetical protein
MHVPAVFRQSSAIADRTVEIGEGNFSIPQVAVSSWITPSNGRHTRIDAPRLALAVRD